jgi:hypothetical protein
MSQNLSEEEYLKKHLEELEASKQTNKQQPVNPKVTVDNSRLTDLQYFSFDIKDFPCSIFYPAGTLVKVRAAQVKEIQAYSMVDDNNFYDIVEKMNDMLSSCVRVQYTDGEMGSYLDLRDPDRYYLIFLIRELTFQQGTNLVTKSECKCGQEVSIELKNENFRYYEPNERINKFYNPTLRCFTFETKNGKVYNLAPPTIGIQKSFTEYIIKENSEKKKPNLSFLKIIPFLLHDRTSITIEGIKSKLDEFQKMDDVSFQFLNSAVEKMTFGIKELVKSCSCGLEVHSDMIFPDGPSAIFVIHDAFDQFIKE